MEKLVITDVKFDSNIAQITVNGVKDEPGATLALFRKLSDEGINIDMILSPEPRDGIANPMFSIDESEAEKAADILMSYRKELGFAGVDCKKNMVKITISGAGLMSHSDIVPRVLSCFNSSNANVEAISTSEIAIKVFTEDRKAKRVVDKVRDEFEDYGV